MPNFLAIGQTFTKICRFSIFQYGGFPPSWICGARVWITHERHLVVCITVQNLVGIDAVVSITCMFLDFASLAWKCLFTNPKLGFLGDSNETRAPTANPPNSAQLGGSPYYSPKLHPGPCSSVDVRPRTYRHSDIHRDTQTRVTTIHFASSTTHAKCNYCSAV